MSTPARRRLVIDYRRLQKDCPHGISAAPEENNIFKWNGLIFGPDDTPWEGGTFRLTIEFTEDYPNKPPIVQFISRLFHPNIYADGKICLDILQNNWSPIYDVAAILTSIQSLLSDPNPSSPANTEAARLYQENKREYYKRVEEVVEKSWEESKWIIYYYTIENVSHPGQLCNDSWMNSSHSLQNDTLHCSQIKELASFFLHPKQSGFSMFLNIKIIKNKTEKKKKREK